MGQWVYAVQGEALGSRIDWINKRFLLLASDTEKNEKMSAALMVFLAKLSNLSHAGALLMDRMREQHPDNLSIQFWYYRSEVAHKIDATIKPQCAVI